MSDTKDEAIRWIIRGVIALCIYGGWKLLQEFTTSKECQQWAERFCYLHPQEPTTKYQQCVEALAKDGNTKGSGWCRDALRDLDKK